MRWHRRVSGRRTAVEVSLLLSVDVGYSPVVAHVFTWGTVGVCASMLGNLVLEHVSGGLAQHDASSVVHNKSLHLRRHCGPAPCTASMSKHSLMYHKLSCPCPMSLISVLLPYAVAPPEAARARHRAYNVEVPHDASARVTHTRSVMSGPGCMIARKLRHWWHARSVLIGGWHISALWGHTGIVDCLCGCRSVDYS